MKTILLVGAGKSASILIQYLLKQAPSQGWKLVVADSNLATAQEKAGSSPYGQGIQLNVLEAELRQQLIQQADLVISLLPPSLHLLMATDCLAIGKPLFTASYLDPGVQQLAPEIEKKGLLFLYEMGLDPGIDHMSIMALLASVKSKGGQPLSLLSHCGGLVAQQSDNNPWHYKISWNPNNVVQAGKQGARYKWENQLVTLAYEDLFRIIRPVTINESETFAWYPNRDSLSYLSLYGLESIPTFVRTTLRHPSYIKGWNKLVQFQLTADAPQVAAKGQTTAALVEQFLKFHKQAAAFQHTINEDAFINLLFEYLGLFESTHQIDSEKLTPSALLQICLENVLTMMPNDQDRVIMQHELIYSEGGKKYKTISTLDLNGENSTHTAMAKTVGLPLALTAALYLNGQLNKKGLLIPTQEDFYKTLLPLLQQEGISFVEETVALPT
jgi:saccharopine dehydrogenase-like NADP-dependent oxidoreductase